MTPAQSTLYSLSYQVVSPSVTTMGACSKGCGASARGGAVCTECLIAELPEDMRDAARRWRTQHAKAERTWWELEQMVEKEG